MGFLGAGFFSQQRTQRPLMSYCHCYWSWKVCPLPQEVYCSVLRNCQTVTPVVMKVRMTGVNAVQCTACLAVVAHGV